MSLSLKTDFIASQNCIPDEYIMGIKMKLYLQGHSTICNVKKSRERIPIFAIVITRNLVDILLQEKQNLRLFPEESASVVPA